jgi:diguanylate cyclase (GGDEF)-like protein
MGDLIPGDAPRLPGMGPLALAGGGALLMVALAIAASVFELQHDRDVQRQSEDALALSQLAFDAESLASRMRDLQELGTQPGARTPMVGNQLHEVLRAVDIDQAEWERRVADAQQRNLPPEAKAQLAKLDTAVGALRAAVNLPAEAEPGGTAGAPAGAPRSMAAAPATANATPTTAPPVAPSTAASTASTAAASTSPSAAPSTATSTATSTAASTAASDSAYLLAVETAQGTLRVAVRVSTDRVAFAGYTVSQLASGVVAVASLLALVLGAVLAVLVNRARHESRVAIGVMGQLLRTDPLTGIANRRGLDENLPVEMSRGKRNGKTLTVAMLDLDFFKRYNSRRGHAGGDSLLRTAAQAWRKQLRPTDTLVRYGGEEFTLVLPSCDAEQACQLIDRLRPLLPDGQTFSAGVATWDFNESAEALLRRADEALLLAKKQGRNRTMVAGREDQISLALSVG